MKKLKIVKEDILKQFEEADNARNELLKDTVTSINKEYDEFEEKLDKFVKDAKESI